MLGVDTDPKERMVLIKLDLTTDDRLKAITCLQELGRTLAEVAALPAPSPSGDTAGATALVGFSARFFRGPLTPERDRQPGALRFGLTCPVPAGLRRMQARGDDRFPELATDERLAEKESDLVVLLEAGEEALLEQAVARLRDLAALQPLTLKAVHPGFRPADGRGHLGFQDGTSNLQDIRRKDPAAYRRYIYAHDGEAGHPAYDGGTYLVFRKYVEHVERWTSDSFALRDRSGRSVEGEAARTMAIGRCPWSGLVVDRETGEHLPAAFDEAQTLRAFTESHIRQANPRGQGLTNFGAPVVVRDARILRRSFSFREVCQKTNLERCGLIFLCFQANIEKRGFEFIHNEWLMSNFMGGKDRLLDPDSGIIEPIDGCYYFVPPDRTFPGGVFFA